MPAPGAGERSPLSSDEAGRKIDLGDRNVLDADLDSEE